MNLNLVKPLFTGAACAAVAFAGGIAAQDKAPKDRAPTAPVAAERPHFVTLSDMLGADVVMRATPEDRREAAAEGEAPRRPKGEIEELIIDPTDGTVHWAVVGVGGLLGIGEKAVAVPIRALDCQPKGDHEAVVTIGATEDQLKALPKFDLGQARKSGLRGALRGIEASWRETEGQIASGQPAKPEDVKIREASAETVDLICASNIDDWKVRASDGEFGSVSNSIVRVERTPTIGYLVVSTGGVLGVGDSQYLVPFRAAAIRPEGDSFVWTLPKTKAELKTAVEYKKPDHGVLDTGVCKRAEEFFGTTDLQREKAAREPGTDVRKDYPERR
jgi:hypothetical protein